MRTFFHSEAEVAVAEVFSEILNCPLVTRSDNFFDLGGRSLATIALITKLEARFDVRISVTALVTAPTVEQIASLVSSDQPLPVGSVVPFRRTGSNLPLFCVHGGNGSALPFVALARSLGVNQPFYGLQAMGGENSPISDISIEKMAADYIKEIRQFQPTGPFNVAGWSSGGLVAFEIARQLRAANEKVGLLALIDCEAPISIFQRGGFLKCVTAHIDRLRSMNSSQKLRYVAMIVKRRLGVLGLSLRYKISKKVANEVPKVADEPLEHEHVSHFTALAEQRYIAKVYKGSALLIRTSDVAARFPGDPTLGWDTLVAGGVNIRDICGDHFSIMTEPHVRTLAETLRRELGSSRS